MLRQCGRNAAQIGRKNAKVCLSSRPDPPFSLVYRDLKSTFRMHELNRAGIEAYARNTLSLLYGAPNPAESQSVNKAAAFITDSSSGIFLWARYAVAEAFKQTGRGTMNSKSLLGVLSQMPRELETVYERILDAHKGEDRETFYIILELIDCAKRPLEVSELLQAAHCGGSSFMSRMDELDDDSIQRFHLYLQALGGGLIESVIIDRDQEGDVVLDRMLPRSVQTYLDKGGWQKLLGNRRAAGSGHRRCIELLCAFRSLAGVNLPGGLFANSYRPDLSIYSTYGALKERDHVLDEHAIRKRRPAKSEPHQSWTNIQSRKLTLRLKSLHGYTCMFLPHHAFDFENATGDSTWPLLRHVFDRSFINDHVGLYAAWDGFEDCYPGVLRRPPFLLTSDMHFAIAHELVQHVELALKQTASDVLVPYQGTSSIRELGSFSESQLGTAASLLATAVLCCCRQPTALRCQLVDMLIPFSARLQDDEMLFAIQNAPARVVESLLTTFPGGRLRLQSARLFGSRNEWVEDPRLQPVPSGSHNESEEDLRLEKGFGPLWGVGMRNKLNEATQLLDLFLARGEDVNAVCGPSGTILHATITACLDDRGEDSRRDSQYFLETCINRGADINASGPAGNVLECVWRRANTNYHGNPGKYARHYALSSICSSLSAQSTT
ncbi:hypothetical protein LTR37_008636 [Vermiconidia calcicola]|uniref:Uncharacterized protein n=1 Tax=Vermiconidia calcicola TaxID=1690605 RepID=A0ACC3NAB8_9PEZI|nr:hypothetical protein LTR37_008636 [Vermiconidia calcicola]